MAYASLYRKYRPSTFDEVIGQDAVVRTLRNMVASGNIAHAYLFTGTRGTGKTSVARIFAKAVNCLHPVDGSPCGKCEACRSFSTASSVDFVELDAASNSSVDDIRALREGVKYPPSDSRLRYKVYIIDEVHQLSTAAFNAFLKTLEEPPAYCLFILATTEVQKLPQTILSRCLRFDFRMVEQAQLARHVANLYDKENVAYDEDALWAIARAGAGSVRDTLSVADTCMTAASGKVTYDIVLQVLGANDPSLIAQLTQYIVTGQLPDALRLVNESIARGKSVAVLSHDIALYIRDLLIVKSDANANAYLRMPQQSYERAKQVAEVATSAALVRALGIFSALDGDMRKANSPRTVLESAIARTATLGGNDAIDLCARLAETDRQLAQLNRKIQEGIALVPASSNGANTPQQPSNDAPHQTEEANSQLQAASAEDLTAVANPFDEEPTPVVTPTFVVPDDDMAQSALATKLRGTFIATFREKKMFMLFTILERCDVTLSDNVVTVQVGDNNDIKYCENVSNLFEDIALSVVGTKCDVRFVVKQQKQTQDDDLNMFIGLVGKSKITKK